MTSAATRYTERGGANIAYQARGSGPPDLVMVAGWLTHLDVQAEEAGHRQLVSRMESFSRLITFDKRGVGLSDRVPPDGLPPLEERIDDVRAVMAAAQSSRPYLMGVYEAGPMCMLFAAAHPELVSGLILYATWATGTRKEDYPWAPSPDDNARLLKAIDERWGQGLGAWNYAPSRRHEPEFRDWMGRIERSGATPSTAHRLAETMFDTDVRSVLGSIAVPTLVLHRLTDRMVHPGNGRYLAEHIPGAKLVELPSGDHYLGSEPDSLVDEIERFVTGHVATDLFDRVLATVLFTDIENSTALTVELGDRRMRQLLDEHDHIAHRVVADHRGRVVKTTGDGLLAVFDGPARGIRCAQSLIADTRARTGLTVRAGIHTGELEQRGDDVSGIAVNLAARIADRAAGGEILVSRTLVDLVAGSGLGFTGRGVHELKGVPGQWQLFAVG